MTVATSALLYLDNVHVSFDGFKAINGLSMTINPGEMRAIIGPNGAGKTTLLDIITGKTKPDQGDVLFEGHLDLTQYDETLIARAGIGRKFQKPTIFDCLTVRQNIELALSGSRQILASLLYQEKTEQAARIAEILEIIRLSDQADMSGGILSHGQKQWLEIGMLLAQDPKLLLIDEPVAGMTDAETVETARLLRDIAQTHSVIVIEHDMGFIRDLNVSVTVLAEGRVLADGTLDFVSQHPDVIESYLGR